MAQIIHLGNGEDVERPTKRSRVLVACERCKRRRQKCDNAAPACSNCTRSSATCSYSQHPNSAYVNQLEQKVGMLEARLRRLDQQHLENHDAPNHQPNEAHHEFQTPSSIPPQQSPMTTSSSGQLATGIGLLSSCAAAEPHYFGFSSGLTLAHFVEAGIPHGNSQINLPSLADRPFSKQVPTAQTPLAPIPTHSIGGKYVEAYLSNIQPLYPFINEEELWRIHRKATSEPQSCPAADLARLHLIYAIGSRCTQLLRPRKVEKHVPEGHLMSAMQYIPEVLKHTSTYAVETTLLLALHSMRSPSGASVWHLCGFAMRQCLELGLHRPRPLHGSQASLEQQRRKLFWSIYIFERKSALVLGRPFAISDKDIKIPLPEDSNDDRLDLALHRHYILLYQIHSKIRSTLHCLKSGAPHDRIEAKLSICLQRLEDWKDGIGQRISSTSSNQGTQRLDTVSADSSDSGEESSVRWADRSPAQDKTELLLEYYKARRSLLQPLLTEAGQYTPALSDYAACADASGQICQHYRQLHRLSAMPFTLRDLHAVVIAGFTSIYCIMAYPNLYDARRANEIGACSTVLYVIAEQWKSAKRYRDAFEAVAERLVELLSTTKIQYQHGSSRSTRASGTTSFSHDRNLQNQTWPGNQAASQSGIFSGEETGRTDRTGLMDGLFDDLFEDTSTDMDYGDETLRGLLASEGLDWFLNG